MLKEKSTGELLLDFRRYEDKTYLASQYYKLPLQVMPPHYQDDDGTAFVYLLNPSGGILQGDRLHTKITVGDGAGTYVTTPSSTKFYRMEHDNAEVVNEFSVGTDAVLEYVPGHNVPFAGSDTVQTNIFDLRGDSSLFAVDSTTSGRKARGEVFAYKRFCSETRIYVDGELQLYERADVRPDMIDIGNTAIMGRYDIFSCIYIYRKGRAGSITEKMRSALVRDGHSKCAVTSMTEDLAVIKILTDSVLLLNDIIEDAWGIWRRGELQKEPVRIRKY